MRRYERKSTNIKTPLFREARARKTLYPWKKSCGRNTSSTGPDANVFFYYSHRFDVVIYSRCLHVFYGYLTFFFFNQTPVCYGHFMLLFYFHYTCFVHERQQWFSEIVKRFKKKKKKKNPIQKAFKDSKRNYWVFSPPRHWCQFVFVKKVNYFRFDCILLIYIYVVVSVLFLSNFPPPLHHLPLKIE